MKVKLSKKLRTRIGTLTDVSFLVIFILNNCAVSTNGCQSLTQQ